MPLHFRIETDPIRIQEFLDFTSTERYQILLDQVPENYLDASNNIKGYEEITELIRRKFHGRYHNLCDITDEGDLIALTWDVRNSDWNKRTSNGIPSATIGNYAALLGIRIPTQRIS